MATSHRAGWPPAGCRAFPRPGHAGTRRDRRAAATGSAAPGDSRRAHLPRTANGLRALAPVRHQAGRRRHPRRLGPKRTSTRRRQTVRAAHPAIDDLLAHQLHVALSGESVQRRVQRPGRQPDPAARQVLRALNDRITVQGPVQQGRQHEIGWLSHLSSRLTHQANISSLPTYSNSRNRHETTQLPGPRQRTAETERRPPERSTCMASTWEPPTEIRPKVRSSRMKTARKLAHDERFEKRAAVREYIHREVLASPGQLPGCRPCSRPRKGTIRAWRHAVSATRAPSPLTTGDLAQTRGSTGAAQGAGRAEVSRGYDVNGRRIKSKVTS